MPWDKFEPLHPSESASWQGRMCRHPEHNPPSHQVLRPGEYVWRCPGCGKTTEIIKPETGTGPTLVRPTRPKLEVIEL